MSRREFLKKITWGAVALATTVDKEIDHVKESFIDFSKDRVLPTDLEPEIAKYAFNHTKELGFWIYDYFKLPDDKALLFNKNTLKKIKYKVEDNNLLIKNALSDSDEIIINKLEPNSIIKAMSIEPNKWHTLIPSNISVRHAFNEILDERALDDVWYIKGRNSQVIKGLEAAPKYHHWLKYHLNPNEKARFAKVDIPEEFFFLALSESQLNPRAESSKGAQGHIQLMRYTGRRYGLGLTRYKDERRDIFKATGAACAYINDLFNAFEDWRLVLTGYIVGEGNLIKALEESLKLNRSYNRYYERNYWGGSKQIKTFFEHHKINPDYDNIYETVRKHFLEKSYFATAHYVNMFVAYYLISKKPEMFGFKNLNYQKPVNFKEIKTEEKALLENIIESLAPKGHKDTMHELNAQYTLRIPIPEKFEIRVPIIKK